MDDFKPQQPQKQDDLSSEKPNDFQAAYDEKPETYVTPSGEPTTIEATQQPSLTMPKKKGGAGKWVLGGLVVLLISGLGAVAYWQWAEAEAAKKNLNTTQAELSSAKAKIVALNAEVNDATSDTPAVSPAKNDTTAITDAVTAFIHARVQDKKAEVKINIMKQNGEFAYTNAGVVGGGAARHILKKVDGMWVVIEHGQDEIPQHTIDAYGIPADYRTGQ